MADYERRDRRRDDRGGGNRRPYNNNHNNNNNRKRRRDDREDDDGQDRRGPPAYRQPPPGTRLKKQYLSVAESAMRNAEEDVKEIAKLATDHYDDKYVRDTFVDYSLSLVSEQPFKIVFVAAAVQYANNDKPELVQELLENAGKLAQEHLAQGNWRGLKLVLRFLACCQGLFNDEGVFPVLEELFNRAVDLQTASAEDTLGLELVKIILLTIPYAMASSATGLDDKAAALLHKTDIVASTPHALENLIDPYPTDDETKPMALSSCLIMLQTQLQNEATNGWPLACIPRVYTANTELQSTQHAFPTITVPSPVIPGPNATFPDLYFSLFADQDAESVPPTTNIASSLTRDAIIDTMNLLDYNRHAVAKLMVELDCFWAPETFAKRGMPFDQLKDIPEGKSTWKPEDVVVDAIFSQIMQLPGPEHRLAYYHSIITETCRAAAKTIAPSLGRAIRFFFRNVDLMDMELAYRYMDWFSHHLSNFEFRWKWQEWTGEVDEPAIKPQKSFIIGLVDKQIRLSFAKRIRELLPEEFKPLIVDGQMKDTPDFKFDNPETPYASEGKKVHDLLRKKGSSEEELEAVLDSIKTIATEQGVSDSLVTVTDVFMTCVCHIGSKSLSHVLSFIDRTQGRLKGFGDASPAARRQIISAVVNYWYYQPGTAVNLIDKLLNYQIITPLSVLEYALQDHLDGGKGLSQLQIYEMVSATMGKVTNNVRHIVRARNDVKIADDKRAAYDQALVAERASLRSQFALIEDACAAVASGANDTMIENFDDGSAEGERELITAWGERWTRVWRRKAVVEEAAVAEQAVEAAWVIAQEVAVRAAAEAEEEAQNQAKTEAEEAAAAIEAGTSNGAGENGGANSNGNGHGDGMDEMDDIS